MNAMSFSVGVCVAQGSHVHLAGVISAKLGVHVGGIGFAKNLVESDSLRLDPQQSSIHVSCLSKTLPPNNSKAELASLNTHSFTIMLKSLQMHAKLLVSAGCRLYRAVQLCLCRRQRSSDLGLEPPFDVMGSIHDASSRG